MLKWRLDKSITMVSVWVCDWHHHHLHHQWWWKYLDKALVPLARGHILVQQEMAPSCVYWPIRVSSRNMGIPNIMAKKRYGTRKTPENSTYTEMNFRQGQSKSSQTDELKPVQTGFCLSNTVWPVQNSIQCWAVWSSIWSEYVLTSKMI